MKVSSVGNKGFTGLAVQFPSNAPSDYGYCDDDWNLCHLFYSSTAEWWAGQTPFFTWWPKYMESVRGVYTVFLVDAGTGKIITSKWTVR